MKPAPFAYYAPRTVNEACALVAEYGYEGKVIAGGQSLVPAMNFRLAQPSVLIDLNGVGELFYVRPQPDGALRIGAMTRQRTLEDDPVIAAAAPLLHATMPHIAHVQIRNRGTLGGSLAHADPAAELPAVMVALDARFLLRSSARERWVNATDFYTGLFATALAPEELLVAIEIPLTPPHQGWSIQEIARRRGDYAIVGLAATVQLDPSGRCRDAKLVYLSVGEGPTQAHQAQTALIGQIPDEETIAAAAELAAVQDIEPLADIHASAGYRRHLVKVLGVRALHEAFARAQARM